jgi:MFS family permease
MKEISHSPLAVGIIGLVELIPLIVFGLYGGVVADHFNRRRVILMSEAALMCGALLLFLNALRDAPSTLVLYVVIVFTTMADGIQRPSLDALNQQVIPHELQRAASTLNMMRYTLGAIVGPALGGLISVGPGPHLVYLIDVVTFALSLFFLFGVRAPAVATPEGRPSMSSLFDGVRYAISRRDLLGTYLVDLAAMMLAFRSHAYWRNARKRDIEVDRSTASLRSCYRSGGVIVGRGYRSVWLEPVVVVSSMWSGICWWRRRHQRGLTRCNVEHEHSSRRSRTNGGD